MAAANNADPEVDLLLLEGDGADSEPKGGVSVAASPLAFGAKTTRYGAKWLSVRPA